MRGLILPAGATLESSRNAFRIYDDSILRGHVSACAEHAGHSIPLSHWKTARSLPTSGCGIDKKDLFTLKRLK